MDDDWGLTVEEMDAVEKDALRMINQKRNLSSSSSLPTPNQFMLRLKEPESYLQLSPLKPNPVSRPKDESFKPKEQKVSVKILLHYSGDLAAKFPYNQVVVDAVCVKFLRLFGMLKKGYGPFPFLHCHQQKIFCNMFPALKSR